MTVGLPGLVNNAVIDALEHIGKVVAAAGRLFTHDEPTQSAAEHTNQVLFGPTTAPASPPPPPNNDSGLHTGATGAGQDHTAGADAAQLTDQKLAEMLKHIFASNQAARESRPSSPRSPRSRSRSPRRWATRPR